MFIKMNCNLFNNIYKKIKTFIFYKVPEERFNICNSCKEFNSSSKSCEICNCYLPIKVTIKIASCPLKKW